MVDRKRDGHGWPKDGESEGTKTGIRRRPGLALYPGTERVWAGHSTSGVGVPTMPIGAEVRRQPKPHEARSEQDLGRLGQAIREASTTRPGWWY